MEKTFSEWKEEGFLINKGEHACSRKNEKCYFNESQVTKISKPTRRGSNFNIFGEDWCDNNYTIFPTDGSNDDIGDFGDWS